MYYLCNEKVVIISNWNPHTVLVEIKTSTIFWENYWQFLTKVKCVLWQSYLWWCAVSFLSVPTDARLQQDFQQGPGWSQVPAPSGLPAHLKDGGDPLLPNAAWAFVHLTGPLPFGTTPTAETAKQPEVATTVFNLGLALPLHTSAWIQR